MKLIGVIVVKLGVIVYDNVAKVHAGESEQATKRKVIKIYCLKFYFFNMRRRLENKNRSFTAIKRRLQPPALLYYI